MTHRTVRSPHPVPLPLPPLRPTEGGFVFLSALIIMVILGAVCAVLISEAQFEQQNAARFARSLHARTVAESGVDLFVNRIEAGAPLPPGGLPAFPGAIGDATYVVQASRLDPQRYAALLRNATPSATLMEIHSRGGVPGPGGRLVEQSVTAVIDNRPSRPRVLLWCYESPGGRGHE